MPPLAKLHRCRDAQYTRQEIARNRFRLLQEQQLHKLKILNAAAAAAGDAALENGAAHQGNNTTNGNSRQLSLETNKRRKVQEKRQKMVALKEEKRRQEILLQRRQLQQDATERFQRAPIQNNKNRTTRTHLDDLLGIIRGGSASCNNTVPPTRQQRSSSARVLSKDRDKRSNALLNGVNKLLTNRPSSQPSRTFPNAHLHDQSLRNLTNSRNLFEQQLRRKLQQQDQATECEQLPVSPGAAEDTDSENDLYSVDSVEADARQDQVVGEQGHFIGSVEGNVQKQKQTSSNRVQIFGFKTEPIQINGQTNLAATRECSTDSNEEQHQIRHANEILQQQQQQQLPFGPQKNPPALLTLASGDSKNAAWAPSQANENPSFQKTAWIQPSLIVNNNGLDGLCQPMPAWVNPSETRPHFDDVCQTHPKEVDENQSCSQQQSNRTLPSKGRPPICGAPIRPTTFQPKHNFYERQLSTTFHPITNGVSQQRPVWLTEREAQSKIFPHPQATEQYPEQTRPQGYSDAFPYSQSKNDLPVSDKKKLEENKRKCPQGTGPIEPSDRNGHNSLKRAEKSENINNATIPGDTIDRQAIITRQTQPNPQTLTKSKTKKNNAWQESGQKTVPKKPPLPPGKGKPIRSILKVTSAELSISPAALQRREIRDSLEITRLLLNNGHGETTEAKAPSKSIKKHVHFAVEEQFCEVSDELETSNVAENKKIFSPDNNNTNKYSHAQQQQQQQQHNGDIQPKANTNGKESDNKDLFFHKPWQKSQINWVQPNGRPQAKAHIIKHTAEAAEVGQKITDPAPPTVIFTDKKGNNERPPLSKNNNIQYITMGTLKKMSAPTNPGSSNPKNPHPRKEIETTITKEQTPFPNSNFPVDKTPTDDEITWLWDKVQMCLQQKATSKPVAPQTVIRPKPIVSHMYMDGGILGKSSGLSAGGKTPPSSFWHPPMCNGGVTPAGQMTANYAKRLALLHRRASPTVPRVPMTATAEKVPLPLSESGNPPLSSESRFPATFSNEVTNSLAGFLKAEELSRMVSVTESQALAAMKKAEVGSPPQGGASPKYRGPLSILSLEEKRLMESLERINNKLKGCPPDYSQNAMNVLPKHLFLTDQSGIKMPQMRYQVPQPSSPSQATPKGWLKGPEF